MLATSCARPPAISVARSALAAARPAETLRVCADPDNLPFTDSRGAGFENQVVQRVASELGLRVEYVWVPRQAGWLGETLGAGLCDVVPGVPTFTHQALVTAPYYRSTYFFLRRADTPRSTMEPADPASRRLRIGIQMVTDDFLNTPPAHAVAQRGLLDERHGWFVHADDREGPPARLVRALVRGQVDVAIVWGPVAGWFAARQPLRFELLAVQPGTALPSSPLVLDVALAVRWDRPGLRDRLDAALERVRPDLDRVLAAYGVPRLDPPMLVPPGEEPAPLADELAPPGEEP
jgi:mxaJ protein